MVTSITAKYKLVVQLEYSVVLQKVYAKSKKMEKKIKTRIWKKNCLNIKNLDKFKKFMSHLRHQT